MNKLLLYVTGIIVLAFVITFPTRDRRGIVDQIRLKVGAKDLVSKQTLRDLASEQRRKAGKKGNKFATDSATTLLDRQERLNKSVTFYCNQEFSRPTCTQWLTYCGESCRTLVNSQTWNTIMNPRRPASVTHRSQTVAARSRGR